ncbi:SOS response-associated peptidase family protein [Erythrobacter sp. EC-HK427]|uniref:SOS response-associated peptidase family protein n=1 Tax=Erythrobacter sp. EC-HK427 TaxID=2038396 RepID=UPI001259F93A|nr:SOS response-associated peptidase family protein [Erythrobacter sp. EC-HK427]VVT09625.1 putative SOS response-associated peptidase [Erythrobacter sp. EC-HK427]
MTTLYRCDADAGAIASTFGIAAGEDPWSGGYVAPGRFAPVITAGREFVAGPGGERQPWRMVPRLWGVPPPRTAHDAGRPVLRVRNPDSPFWIGSLRNPEFRCLVPATAIMEWGLEGRNAKRRQHWLACTDQQVFAMAGVWMDSEVPSFALLTAEPNAVFKRLRRDAMPAILPPDPRVWRAWLHGGWDAASGLLQPYSSGLMGEFDPNIRSS